MAQNSAELTYGQFYDMFFMSTTTATTCTTTTTTTEPTADSPAAAQICRCSWYHNENDNCGILMTENRRNPNGQTREN